MSFIKEPEMCRLLSPILNMAKKRFQSIFTCLINELFWGWVYLNIKFMYVSYPPYINSQKLVISSIFISLHFYYNLSYWSKCVIFLIVLSYPYFKEFYFFGAL